jgi:hypothetical protein
VAGTTYPISPPPPSQRGSGTNVDNLPIASDASVNPAKATTGVPAMTRSRGSSLLRARSHVVCGTRPHRDPRAWAVSVPLNWTLSYASSPLQCRDSDDGDSDLRFNRSWFAGIVYYFCRGRTERGAGRHARTLSTRRTSARRHRRDEGSDPGTQDQSLRHGYLSGLAGCRGEVAFASMDSSSSRARCGQLVNRADGLRCQIAPAWGRTVSIMGRTFWRPAAAAPVGISLSRRR